MVRRAPAFFEIGTRNDQIAFAARLRAAAMVLESLIEPLILNSAKKYIANLDISALRLSIFGGDVVLQNLELKLEVLRQEFAAGLPIHFRRGFVRELRIRIPWLQVCRSPLAAPHSRSSPVLLADWTVLQLLAEPIPVRHAAS